MKIKFAFFQNSDGKMELEKFEFNTEEEAWDLITKQLKMFKENNQVEDDTKDKAYIHYKCKLLNSLAFQLTKEKDDFDHCKICPKKDWEGSDKQFCRCENRNMRVATVNRMKKEAIECAM